MKDLIQSVNNQSTIFGDIISSIGFDQEKMILDIIKLHCKTDIQLDATYSTGGFYKGRVKAPKYKFDIKPQVPGVVCCRSENLPVDSGSIDTIMYDPPFLSGGYLKNPSEYKITKRFGSIENMGKLWRMYYASMNEFHRILNLGGILIFKCQDCVDGRYNWMSHVEVMNMAHSLGYYPKDLFILMSKNRIISKHNKQCHARKFHCYFWVLQKKRCYIKYGTGANYNYNEQPGKRVRRKKRAKK